MPHTGKANSPVYNSATSLSPLRLRGEPDQDADVTNADQEQGYNHGTPSYSPTAWYVRLGQSVSGFFLRLAINLLPYGVV